jgi:hypothetical protein
MARPRRTLPVPFAILLAATAAAPALAETKPAEIVYATDYLTNRVLRVDFDTLTTTQVNSQADAQRRKKLKGLTVRADAASVINLIVADGLGSAGAVLFYPDVENPSFDGNSQVITTAIPLPDGPSLDASGNLYVLSSGSGRSDACRRRVFRILRNGSGPGGYGSAQVIDGAVPSDDLDDTKVVRSSGGKLSAGDLLVLSAHPARVFRYPGGTPCANPNACTAAERTEFVPSSAFPRGCADPEGMAFAPDGSLLVSTNAGDVIQFSNTGTLVNPTFTSGVGPGVFKIAVGFQGGQNRLFLTQAVGHNVYAFNLPPSGPPTLAGQPVRQGLVFPLGVGIGTGRAAPTPQGTGVTVQLDTFRSTFDQITTTGLTDAACAFYVDPREGCTSSASCTGGGACTSGFCVEDLPLTRLNPALPPAVIPSYVRTFRRFDPATGPPTIFICQTATTAQFAGSINHVEEEGEWLQWPHTGPEPLPGNGEPACRDSEPGGSDRTQQSRSFWAPTPGTEPPIVEGSRFIDISNGCTASNRSTPPNYSLFLPAVRDTRALKGGGGVVDDKLASLLSTVQEFKHEGLIIGKASTSVVACPALDEPGCPEAHEDIEEEVKDAIKLGFQKKKYKFAICELTDVLTILADPQNASKFNNSTRPVTGELKARAESAIFMLCKLDPAGLGCPVNP